MPSSYLLVEDDRGEILRFALTDETSWREGLVVSHEGCVLESGYYKFYVETPLDVRPDSLKLQVNGEEVARGSFSTQRTTRADGTYVYPLDFKPMPQPFSLIVGYARAELEVATDESLRYASTEDIPVLSYGNQAYEEERVSLMFSALFDNDGDGALEWMLTGTPAEGKRFSIVEGSAAMLSSRSVSTFLQLAERVLVGFEDCLSAFRQRAASRVGRAVTRIDRKNVVQVGSREALWIAHNLGALERVRGRVGISDGRSSYLPRYIETERRTKTYDIYENQVLVAFLDHATRQLLRLSSLLNDHAEHERSVLSALSPYTRDGYVLSSLLVTSVSARRRAQVQGSLRRLADKARQLRDAYLRAVPDVRTMPFRPPRRSKLFQEVDPYIRLYRYMQTWCSFGDLDIASEGIALRTERMDTFYELYVLHELLAALRAMGFVADESEDTAISRVRYSNMGQFDTGDKQVANRYFLRRGTTRAQLYYEPVFDAGPREEHGVTLHRTAMASGWGSSPYTPDFLLRVSHDGGAWRDFVFDAKYRYVAGVTNNADRELRLPDRKLAQVPELLSCLFKYKLGCMASDTLRAPEAVWLLCGRDNSEKLSRYEDSAWAARAAGLVASGAASVSPKANLVAEVLRMFGLDGEEPRGALAEAAVEAEQRHVVEPGPAPMPEPEPVVEPETAPEPEVVPEPVAVATPPLEPAPETAPAKQPAPKAKKPAKQPKQPAAKPMKPARSATLDLVTSLYDVMPDGSLLFDANWVRWNIGINMPLLRQKAAKKYAKATIGGEDVFYLAQMLPPDRAKVQRAIKMYVEQGTG